MRRIVALILALLAAAAGAVFGLAWIAADSILRPARHAITRSPSDFGLVFEEVSFAAPDGTELRGWWIPAERPRAAVVLLHGFGSDRTELLDHAPYLHEAGFDLLLFDLRACGESGGELSTLGWREQDDLRAAVDLVEARTDGRPTFAMGHSLGSATAILEGAADLRLRAFVVEAPFTSIDDIVDRSFPHFSHPSLPSFPFAPVAVVIAEARLGRDSSTIRPLDAIGRLAPRPLLIVTGAHDEVVPPPDAQRLYAAAGVGAEWWLIQGAGHSGSVDEPFVAAPAEYRRRVLRLFEAALAGSAD
jgi:alpha-beta hydrolase superfamily lysophospholipase